MFALMLFGSFLFAGLVVMGLLFGALGWLLTLPFRILGAVFQLLGVLITLPFILLGLVLGALGLALGVVLGVGVLLLPLAPLAAIGLILWWLLRRREPERSGAKVVS